MVLRREFSFVLIAESAALAAEKAKAQIDRAVMKVFFIKFGGVFRLFKVTDAFEKKLVNELNS